MNDLISRQAALEKVRAMQTYKLFVGDDMILVDKAEVQTELMMLPSAQPELDLETLIRTIETGITATNSNDSYSLGMRNDMRWCKGLIDGAEPKFEDDVMSVDDGKGLPSAQPDRKKGKWISHSETCREYIGTVLVRVDYDYWFCDACGYRVENGQPMYKFCLNCGADMRGE